MNILITEGGASSNVGSTALILNCLNIVKKMWPDAHVTIMCHDKTGIKEIVGKEADVLYELIVPTLDQNKIVFLAKNMSWVIMYYMYRSMKKLSIDMERFLFFDDNKKDGFIAISRCDLVFCVGAERINDLFIKSVMYSLFMLRVMQNEGKKIIHFSLTYGPVKNVMSGYMAKKVLSESMYIYVRDSKSYEDILGIGVEKKKLKNFYDIALLQDCTDKDNLQYILEKNDIDMNQKIVGVSVLRWGYRNAMGPARIDDYINSFAKILDYAIDNYSYRILFIPMVVNKYHADDVEIAKNIISKMRNKNNMVRELNGKYKPDEIAGIFSAMEFSIVTRMHAAILCTGAFTPVISINYQFKLREYMRNIDMEKYGLDIDYINFNDLKCLVDRLVNNLLQEKKRLREKIESIRDGMKKEILLLRDNIGL